MMLDTIVIAEGVMWGLAVGLSAGFIALSIVLVVRFFKQVSS